MAPRRPSYRSNMFESSALASPEAMENAVSEFVEIVNEANIQRILDDLISNERPGVLRLVLSCLDKELILGQFPLSPEAFAGSLTYKILSQLSEFFLFAHSVPSLNGKHHQLVKEAPGVLAAIASKLLGSEREQADSGDKRAKGTSQKTAKMARRAAAQQKSDLDPDPFERLDIAVPDTREELEKSIEIILATQRSILEAYLESLRLPAVAASVKAAFIPSEPAFSGETEEASEFRESDAESVLQSPQTTTNSPLADPSFHTIQHQQPLKFSTLYRKRAAGFGEWEITIAPRAERDLRVYSRRDRGTFFLIVKKMRDLSNGDFSRDNYRQINGSSIEIPIYQAKVTNDLRLAYQIDCAPTHDAKSEQQMIKVFGIYEDAQLSGGSFWDSMSRQLGKKGEEYKDRCTRRQRAPGTDEAVFLPIEFSVQEEARLNPGSVPDLPSDDAEQIQSLLLKTVHFSQPLLESIMADLDVAFVLKISPKELDIIEHPHSCYVLGRSGTGKTTTMLYKMLLVEASDEANPEFRKSRQLFVTQSRILAEKVGEHFGKLLGGYRPSALSENAKAAIKADRALVAGEESDWRSDLPKKYSDLQDADFPLFVSFDQLCTMLERDMEATGDVENGLATSPWLTFKRFKSEYWPHFPEALRKGFDPSMVFSEFLGVIMGSEQALASGSSRLDRDVYLNLGKRGQSTFADQRDRIYDLFEKYTSQKRRQNDYDAADRTHAILRFLQSHGNPGRNIDYLYVDEAQDNLLLDGLVLRYLCPNTQGLFWAGDTAQTINVGSSFRFNELKAFFFRIERRRQKKHPEFGFQAAAPPRTFQLTVNYRSHSGIVNCAHSVIEVITKLWPDAIDLLERERGTVDGLRPIFFTSWDSENIDSKQFLFGNQASGSYNELGAHQCIIVRNEAAKENLQKEVGEIGLIMTLPESKGLEFNDVLLYNFFEDSNVLETQWRVVLNAMDRSKDTPPAPPFDKIRHASVCTELKSLYVAITRARNNIWIADCSTKGEPMRTLWKSQDLVQNCGLGTDTPRFAISSTPAEWESRGRQLFDNQLFSQARLSFERAYMPHEAAVAQAYHHREVANEMPNNSRREIAAKKAALIEVANAFVGCAKNDPGDAAKVYFRRAGECFEHAGDVTQAINAYTGARHFSRVAELYRSLGKIDEAVATVQNHPQDISRDTAERVFGVARLFYFNKGQIEKAGRLFDTLEEALEYLEDRGLNAERATLLEILGRSSDAAEIHLAEGRTPEAVTLFLQDHQPDRAIQCVLHGLWQRISFAVLPDTKDSITCRLLDLAVKVDLSSVSGGNRDEISVFLDLANGKVSNPLFAGQLFTGSNNGALALFCLDHYFTNPPKTQALMLFKLYKNSRAREMIFARSDCPKSCARKVDDARAELMMRARNFTELRPLCKRIPRTFNNFLDGAVLVLDARRC
ncbi:P-loop containing nucleoside triphosphate hydrolase protein [Mycena galericulata]|nr:P-loop containing nucleoside triphosphate hydrolase protein [Mycena galericulata]